MLQLSSSKPKDYRSEMMDKVSSWLLEQDFSFLSINDDLAFSNFQVKYGDLFIHVLIDKKGYDSIKIGATIGMTPDDLKLFSYLKPDKRGEFLRQCEELLLHSDITYHVRPDWQNLEEIMITKTIFYDGLTKQSLFDGLRTIARALTIMNLQYAKLRSLK